MSRGIIYSGIVFCGFKRHKIPMNERQVRFTQEYCKDFNATQAAKRAGYSEKTAYSKGHELLKHDEVRAAIEERKTELAEAAALNPAWVLNQWKQIATADARELSHVRRVNCRFCHGYDGNYQWTEAEYRVALDRAIEAGKPAPDGIGGFGYDPKRDPNEACGECGGEGDEVAHFADSRKVKTNSWRLFAGVKKTKDGLQIVTRDQDAALANIARYLGMSLERKEISGPGGGPVPVAHLTAEDLTDDQLAALLADDEPANADEA